MDEQKQEMIELEAKSPVFKWLVVLLFSIFLTVGLYFYNYYLENSLDSIKIEVKEIDELTEKLKNDKNIQVYNLVDLNRTKLLGLEKKSRIMDFINHVRALEKTYSIIFKGFSYNNWNLSMQATAPFWEDTLASNKVSLFIKSYRETSWNPFELTFINSFIWYDTINFNVNFKLK